MSDSEKLSTITDTTHKVNSQHTPYDTIQYDQGSDTRVAGTYPPKNPVGFWVHPPKNPTPKNPHFYFNLILVYTLYATNSAIFYCFKAFKALSY